MTILRAAEWSTSSSSEPRYLFPSTARIVPPTGSTLARAISRATVAYDESTKRSHAGPAAAGSSTAQASMYPRARSFWIIGMIPSRLEAAPARTLQDPLSGL